MTAHLLLSNHTLSNLEGSTRPGTEVKPLQQIRELAEHYLCVATLNERLEDLSRQFQQPHTRPWQRIEWHNIHPSQIVGIDPVVFIAILAGAADTEDPIRGYTQTSRQYLEPLYPKMARFVGGSVDGNGKLIEIGLWEKEERRHTPALQKLYSQLTGLQLRLLPTTPRTYQPSGNAHTDLYRHGLHRIATEYGATCLYLWLMAHTTGPLQTVLEELLIDEINHLTKFWGFGRWAFPDASRVTVLQTILQSAWHRQWQRDRGSSFLHTWRHMAQTLHWEAWSWANQLSFLWTLTVVLHRLQHWSNSLTPQSLT
ncbi:MAG TPA: hypothetical protein V6D19_03545, partial [Stenomitos sp.]